MTGLQHLLADPEVLELYNNQRQYTNPPSLVQCALLVLLWRNTCWAVGEAKALSGKGLPL